MDVIGSALRLCSVELREADPDCFVVPGGVDDPHAVCGTAIEAGVARRGERP